MQALMEPTGSNPERVTRPPSVGERLWEAVPEGLREEFLHAAADALRRGIHPETTFESMLKARSLRIPTVTAPRPVAMRPRQVPSAVPRPVPSTPRPPAPKSAPFSLAATRKPATLAEAARSCGLDASAIARLSEWISIDPFMAASDPLGHPAARRAGGSGAETLASMVAAEAEARIGELRRMKEAGDPRALSWIDPDGWSFGLADEPSSVGARP